MKTTEQQLINAAVTPVEQQLVIEATGFPQGSQPREFVFQTLHEQILRRQQEQTLRTRRLAIIKAAVKGTMLGGTRNNAELAAMLRTSLLRTIDPFGAGASKKQISSIQ